MSSYIECHDKIAYHPGYYIEETIENSGFTLEDFAKKININPIQLSELINGRDSLSIDIAIQLSQLLKTSVNYWLNLQNSYDAFLNVRPYVA